MHVNSDRTSLALIVTLLLVGLTGTSRAQILVDRPGSIVVFPRIVVDSSRDTVIQITNTTNNLRFARCFYVNAAGFCLQSQLPCFTSADCSIGDSCMTGWAPAEFDLALVRQQPLQWAVSRGRSVSDAGQGLSNLIPSLSSAFQGELLCVEIDASGAALSGNSLTGQATLADRSSTDAATYGAIALQGSDANNGDNTLCLGGGISDACPFGPEYAACPQSWVLDQIADGAQDALAGIDSTISSRLTVVPCSQDLTSHSATDTILMFSVHNESASSFSTSLPAHGWGEVALGGGVNRSVLGSDYAQVRVIPSSAIFVTAQEFHQAGSGATASAAIGAHPAGDNPSGSQIQLPAAVPLPPPPGATLFPTSGVMRITAGPDGNLWFTGISFANPDVPQDQIGRITPDGASIAEFLLPTSVVDLAGITASPDGNVWFIESLANETRIGRISTDGATLNDFALPAGAGASEITAGPDGNLWFTDPVLNQIGRITPDGASVVEFPLPTSGSGPRGITTGPDGNLWFTETFAGQVGRITPDGASIAEFALSSPGAAPVGIATGADGNLWFTETSFFSPAIGRIAPSGSALTEFPLGFPLRAPEITGAPDGNLWFTTTGGLGRITTAGTAAVFPFVGGNSITLGSDGKLWLVSTFGITRFAP